jgi:hypothetical protein
VLCNKLVLNFCKYNIVAQKIYNIKLELLAVHLQFAQRTHLLHCSANAYASYAHPDKLKIHKITSHILIFHAKK